MQITSAMCECKLALIGIVVNSGQRIKHKISKTKHT